MAAKASNPQTRVAVLFSGRGSNFEAVLNKQTNYQVILAVCNKPEARGLDVARRYGVPNLCIDHRNFENREAFDAALAEAIDEQEPQLIVMAGFMRILTPAFADKYTGRLINLHPSLLPNFPGLHAHKQALESGTERHGATVHFATAELDAGPIIAQWDLTIAKQDSLETLTDRVLAVEHKLLPEVIALFAQKRVVLAAHQAVFDGKPLPKEGLQMRHLYPLSTQPAAVAAQ